LEHDEAIDHVEESTSTKAKRVFSFEDRPFTVLEYLFRNAGHVGCGELVFEHLVNRFTTLNRIVRHLVIHRIFL